MFKLHKQQRALIAIPKRDDQRAVIVSALGQGIEPAVNRHDSLADMLAKNPVRKNGNVPDSPRPKPGVYIWEGDMETDMHSSGFLHSWHGLFRLLSPTECGAMINGNGDPWQSLRNTGNIDWW